MVLVFAWLGVTVITAQRLFSVTAAGDAVRGHIGASGCSVLNTDQLPGLGLERGLQVIPLATDIPTQVFRAVFGPVAQPSR